MAELDTSLICRYESEDVIAGAVEVAFEHGQVRDHASSVEVLEAIEYKLVVLGGDFEIIVSRVNGAANEIIVRDDELLIAIGLFLCTDNISGGTPEKVVAK